jgi:hypothetical protein
MPGIGLPVIKPFNEENCQQVLAAFQRKEYVEEYWYGF